MKILVAILALSVAGLSFGAEPVIDNDNVVVWDYAWHPNEPSPMHFHDKDTPVVYLKVTPSLPN